MADRRALAEEFFAGEGARERSPHGIRGRRRQAVDLQLPGRRPGAHFCDMRAAFPAAGRCGAPALVRGAARNLVPRQRAAARGGRCGVSQRRGGERGGARRRADPPHRVARTAMAGLSSCGRRQPVPAEDAAGAPARRPAEPHTRLARAIAATIRHWLDSGEQLEARGRAIAPRRHHGAGTPAHRFVADLLRALKQRGVPVAGADRLVLTDQLAVQDLVALGRFLLLPEDDLTLATVLKGPLFEHLRGRAVPARLWPGAVRAAVEPGTAVRGGNIRRLRRAAERLSALLARADFVPPFEFFAEVLGAAGGRRLCWNASAPRRPTRSTSSSPWRSPTSASTSRHCRAFCIGSSPATSRSSAISASASATRCAS